MAFCFDCGTKLLPRYLDGQNRLSCPNCGWVYYPQLKVSAAGLIESRGKVLLVRRKNWPWQGCWYLPAGYVEADEDPATAAIREVREETGFIVKVVRLFGCYYFDDDPRGNGLLLVYHCQLVEGKISLSEEVDAAEYFSPGNLPDALTGAGHEQAIHDWRFTQTDQKDVLIGGVQ